MQKTIVTERPITDVEGVFLKDVITNGKYKRKLAEHMGETWSDTNMNNVFINATRALLKFVSPKSSVDKMTKLLCLGKVQSGKTAFFISSMALAFDNGYDIAYVIGGTKNNLLSQNKDRILEEFDNNEDILIMDLNNAKATAVRQQIKHGCKVILMVLKHKSKNSSTNLANLERLARELSDIPSLIVDDEGDERSPGTKPSNKAGKTSSGGQASNAILQSIKSIKKGTYLSVTATPQSNLLLSTALENLSPDDCVLVEPGVGYTGAMVFHDTMENPLVCEISDADDFQEGVPASFKEALYWFVLGGAVRYLRGDTSFHSMLVHPSGKTDIHQNVYNKIKTELEILRDTVSDDTSFGYDDICDSLEDVYNLHKTTEGDFPPFISVLEQIKKNVAKMDVYQINTREGSDNQEDIGRDKFFKYKIYVGGNMLERGITIKNLAVTYIYRTAKRNSVDTTLQRARWFGYKLGYLDLCRVYMTEDMKQQFVDITNHENFLWETVARFLKTGRPLEEMERVFRLDNDKLVLTRTSVAKTIKLGSINSGYVYDRSIDYANPNAPASNYKLLEDYFAEIDDFPEYYRYGKTEEHKHRIFRNISFSDFYEKVISGYQFPRVCKNVNAHAFISIQEAIQEGLLPQTFTLVKMRDGENQFRSTMADGRAIKELPESYQVTNGYVGDKCVLKDEFFVQVHYVYTDKSRPEVIIPFFTINNPSDNIKIQYVTGEFNV